MSTFNGGKLPRELQSGAQLILAYLVDLFTVATKTEFSSVEVLVILNMVKNDVDLFDLDEIIAAEAIETQIGL